MISSQTMSLKTGGTRMRAYEIECKARTTHSFGYAKIRAAESKKFIKYRLLSERKSS